MEKANLKALIKGIDLTDYQRALALNEFKQMESQLQSLQEERDRLIRAVESWKEEEKMWKEFNTQLEKERDRLRDVLLMGSRELIGDSRKVFKELDKDLNWKSFYTGWIQGRSDLMQQALQSDQSDEITSSSSIQ